MEANLSLLRSSLSRLAQLSLILAQLTSSLFSSYLFSLWFFLFSQKGLSMGSIILQVVFTKLGHPLPGPLGVIWYYMFWKIKRSENLEMRPWSKEETKVKFNHNCKQIKLTTSNSMEGCMVGLVESTKANPNLLNYLERECIRYP